MYLSANFAAPIRLGGLKTADPLDPGVTAWWKAKADEIYKLIPDFGGFLRQGELRRTARARRTTAAITPRARTASPTRSRAHGGNVIWRAFIYDEDVDPDRAKRAYIEFTKLDGQFRPNVLVQVKNGAIDFMPREPFHPLFGALNKTPVIAEIQATQEYLGQAKHLVYLGTMWEEFLDSDTLREGQGLDRRQGARGRRHPAARHRHRVGAQPRPRPQLVRTSLLAVQLVRLRPAGVESGAPGAADRRRVDAHDVHATTQRPSRPSAT